MNGNNWYKSMVVYQIWCRSFCDGNGDGIGDLWGVLSKLDYIKSLGADAIWFSPIYPSPNADYGYDISDYMNIHPDFGNLGIFKEVLDGAHKRGMKVFMDLVVNHTSDEHKWFIESKKGDDNPYHDYYYWRKGKVVDGKRVPPNNWTSLFEGGAWEYDEGLDEYYLHVFAKKQPDLNMANPKVREEVKKILKFWLDMGVDGFREDVITFIDKAEGLPDDYPVRDRGTGARYYVDRPKVHQYLKEFRADVLSHYDCYTIGEAPGTSPEGCLRYTAEGPDHVLDEMISFEPMDADGDSLTGLPKKFDLVQMKTAFTNWQNVLAAGKAWNSLYIENHDHPRIISRYGSEKYWKESGKMLAAMYMLQRGTPFVYQGQELGMMNLRLDSVDKYIDIASKNNARIYSKTMSKEEVLKAIQASTRDSARTPVQWSSDENAGFTTGKPWFYVNPNYTTVNEADEDKDPDSILNFYRQLIKYRKESPVAVWGDFKEFYPDDTNFYVYQRTYEGKRLLVICCFSGQPLTFTAPEGYDLSKGKLAVTNYPTESAKIDGSTFTTRPYELRVYEFD